MSNLIQAGFANGGRFKASFKTDDMGGGSERASIAASDTRVYSGAVLGARECDWDLIYIYEGVGGTVIPTAVTVTPLIEVAPFTSGRTNEELQLLEGHDFNWNALNTGDSLLPDGQFPAYTNAAPAEVASPPVGILPVRKRLFRCPFLFRVNFTIALTGGTLPWVQMSVYAIGLV